MSDSPETIFLHATPGLGGEQDMYWSRSRVSSEDVEYVRADKRTETKAMDLPERLRTAQNTVAGVAADEIERLRAENGELRRSLALAVDLLRQEGITAVTLERPA